MASSSASARSPSQWRRPCARAAALAFYREIKAAAEANAKDKAYQSGQYETFPMVGLAQPTFQSATLSGGKITLLRSSKGKDYGGDGTVPRFSATPLEMSDSRREIYVAEQHGSLQDFDPALVNLVGVLTGQDINLGQFNFAPLATLSLDIDDVYSTDDVVLRATPSMEAPIRAKVYDTQSGALTQDIPLAPDGDTFVGRTRLPPGSYRAKVTAEFAGNPMTVTEAFLTVS